METSKSAMQSPEGTGDYLEVWLGGVTRFDEEPKWYWHLCAANHTVIGHGQGHTREADAWRAAIRAHKEFESLLEPDEPGVDVSTSEKWWTILNGDHGVDVSARNGDVILEVQSVDTAAWQMMALTGDEVDRLIGALRAAKAAVR